MTVAVSRAKGAGAEAIICASTGNTAASCAAYAARAGLRGAVIVPEGQDRDRQAGPGADPRGSRDRPARQLRPGARDRPRARRPAPGRAGQLGQPVPDRGPEDGRVRGLRRARAARRARDPGRQRRQHHRLVAGLPGVRGRARCCTGSRPRARRRSSSAGRSPSRRRSRRRSGSAIRLAGRRRWTPSPPRAGGSPPSPTSRSSMPTTCWPRARASSASRRRPRRSPGSWRTACPRPRVGEPPSSVVCVLTGHGLKDPDTALAKAPSVVGCEAEVEAVERAVFEDD